MFLAYLSARSESVRCPGFFLIRPYLDVQTKPASYLPLIAHLRKVIARAHKKAYTISVGKLNPAKLANFAEIECFVLVACPENSLVDAKVGTIDTLLIISPALSDQLIIDVCQEFFRPIVTPFELQLALQPSPTWTGEYVLDFDEVLTRGSPRPSPDVEEGEDDPDRPIFSLVTGRYRHAKRYGGGSCSDLNLFLAEILQHRGRSETCTNVTIL